MIDNTSPQDIDEPGLRRFVVEGFVGKNQYDNTVCSLAVNGVLLDIKNSLKVASHSPDGFTWGYGGSGPAQSALAILQHLFGDEFAQTHHQEFKWAVTAKLKIDQPFHVVVSMREKEGEYTFTFMKAETEISATLPKREWAVEFDDAFESKDDATGKPCMEITVAARNDKATVFDVPIFEFNGTIIELLAEVEKRKKEIIEKYADAGYIGVQFNADEVTQAEKEAIENRTTTCITVTMV